MNMENNKNTKKPLIYYYGIVLIALMLFNFLLMPYMVSRQIVEVDYGTFMTEIEEGTLDTVQLQDNRILFTTKDSSIVYKTGLVDDPTLTQRLYDSGVTFSSKIVETASPFQTILLYWILPMAVFAIIGQFAAHKMMENGGKGQNIMSFGMGKEQCKGLRKVIRGNQVF